jgi:hypothetical protein
MKKNASYSIKARITLTGAILLGLLSLTGTYAQNPSSGTVGPSPGGPSAAWDGTATAPGGGVNTEASCVNGVNCEIFTLTVTSPLGNWVGQRVRVRTATLRARPAARS